MHLSSVTATRTATVLEPVSLGQFNTWNWFDTVDDPHKIDTVYTPEQYQARIGKMVLMLRDTLGAPDVLALEEIENAQVLDDILARPELAGLGYRYVLGEFADTRGIRNAVLYRAGKVALDSVTQPNPHTDMTPEDPNLPQGDKLFARAPIEAHFTQLGADGARTGAHLTVIANHFKSKLGGPMYEPRRVAQGAFVGDLVDAARAAQPGVPVLVLGDLNATPADGAYKALVARPDGTVRAHDTVDSLPLADRYSYIYRKSHDLLDHLMVDPEHVGAVDGVRILHVDSGSTDKARFVPGTANGISDHDPVLASIHLTPLPA
jgi:predicted extracellular nuclease